jgi:hypothetical protein
MNDPTRPSGSKARWAGAAGLVAAGAVAGGVLAGSLSANAASSPAPAAGTGSPPPSSTQGPPPNFPAHGTPAHESQEKAVTGADATKAQAAAVKALGGGTAGTVTSDFRGGGYEVTVTKADGTSTEVHLDSSFAVRDHGGPHG